MEKGIKKLTKIQLIEEPKSEDLLRSEIEDALAGWTCVCYVNNDTCVGGYSENGICPDGRSGYCSSQYKLH